MARPISLQVREVRQALEGRLRSGRFFPGDRFLSAREVATEFGVSYQTAHRLLTELCEDGLLERRAASGTYLPGRKIEYETATLCFEVRAKRVGSFGARLLAGLRRSLERAGILHTVLWSDETATLATTTFPVLWESSVRLAECRDNGRHALVLNERPAPGLESTVLDSVSLDDFFGGACAAQLLLRGVRHSPRFAIVAGPDDDPRSIARRDGFLSVAPAAIIRAGGWYVEEGTTVAAEALERGMDGIFCCNDRLAEAIVRYCLSSGRERPRLVGFDNAPVAERLNFTTIAIPWEEMINDAVEIIERRLNGDNSAARQRIVTPFPIIRR